MKLLLNYNLLFGLLLFFSGGMCLWKKNKMFFVVFLGSFFSVLLAAILRIYPFFGRLALFLVPIFIILVTSSFEIRLIGKPKANIVISLILVFFIFYGPMKITLRQFLDPFGQEEIKPVLSFLSRNMKESDKIYVFSKTIPAFKYYQPRFGFLDKNCIYGEAHGKLIKKYELDMAKLRPYKRVWFLFSHIVPQEVHLLEKAINEIPHISSNRFSDFASGGVPPSYLDGNGETAKVILIEFKRDELK